MNYSTMNNGQTEIVRLDTITDFLSPIYTLEQSGYPHIPPPKRLVVDLSIRPHKVEYHLNNQVFSALRFGDVITQNYDILFDDVIVWINYIKKMNSPIV